MKAEAAVEFSDHIEEVVVPGSVHLVERDGAGEEIASGAVVLYPQPSDDPDDPLNWAKWRKIVNISLVYFYVFTTGIGGTSTYSILTELSDATGIGLSSLVSGTGYLFLIAGWSNLFWQPLALTFGRRPVYLFSILGCVAMSEWAAHIHSQSAWTACRSLYGFFCAPVEVLPEHNVAELFFAHERGAYMGIYMLVLASSNYIAPLIAGYMNNNIGWQWVQHWCAIILGLNFVLSFFFYEDTLYLRASAEADMADKGITLKTTHTPRPTDSKRTFFSKMRLWTKNPNIGPRQFVDMVWRPVYIFFAFPVVMWAGFYYALSLVWYSVYNATASAVYSGSPYNFSSASVGLSYLGPLIGALIGGIYSGPIADRIMMRLVKRNNGVREPEQRLWGLLFYLFVTPFGIFLWGIGAAHGIKWPGLAVAAALMGIANVVGGSFSLAFIVDCYRDISGEALVSAILCRNSMSFGWNYAITPWIAHSGMQNTFIVVGVLSLVTGITFLLMTFYGKRLRTASAYRYWQFAATSLLKE
jgi:MFS family permease